MTTKELLLQEIETLPPELISEALLLIRSIKLTHTNKGLETAKQEPSVLTEATKTSDDTKQLTYRPASGHSILRHAGTWEGDDFEECLQSVYDTRGKAKFNYENNPFE